MITANATHTRAQLNSRRAPRLLIAGIGAGMDRSLVTIVNMGVDVIVVTDKLSERVSSVAQQVLVADSNDVDGILSGLSHLRVNAVDGVLSLGVDNPPAIAALCRIYGCPGLSEQVAINCTAKDRRIRALEAAGLSVPRYAVASSLREALAQIESIGLPVVVKPTDRTSSIGVAKIEHWSRADELVEEALSLSRAGQIVIEEFLSGTEHTVTGFCVDQKTIITGFSDRDYSRKEAFAPYFFESGDTAPSALSRDAVDRVIAAVVKGVDALRLDPAFFNSDILLSAEGEVYILELTGRLTGARIATEVVPLATGVDPLPNVIRLALGQPLQISELRATTQQFAVQRYEPCRGGVVTWVGNIDNAPRPFGLYDVFWNVEPKVGAPLPVYHSSDDVLAGAIATGSTVRQAERTAIAALQQLPLRLE